MQPEPLLYLGQLIANHSSPRQWSGVYAVSNPVLYADRSGFDPSRDDADTDVTSSDNRPIRSPIQVVDDWMEDTTQAIEDKLHEAGDAVRDWLSIGAGTAGTSPVSGGGPGPSFPTLDPDDPDTLLDQGYGEVSDPRAAAAGHRTFENPDTGDRVRWDKAKEGRPGHAGRNHFHHENPDSGGRGDKYLDADGNPVPDGSNASHLYE